MRVAILRRVRGDSYSMDVYADSVIRGLKTVRPTWDIVEIAPSLPNRTTTNQIAGLQRLYTRYWNYPQTLKHQTFDVYHIIDHSDGHLAYWLHPQPAPTVVTCHDLINLTQPETFKGRAKLPLLSMSLWKYAVYGMQRANHVITVSSHTAKDVTQYLNIDPSDITVIPNAVDSKFQSLPEDKIQTFRQEYGISPNTFCILNVGSNNLRKNIFAILQVVALLKHQGLPIHFWKAGADFSSDQLAFIEANQIEGCVSYLGNPDDQTLIHLYNAADLLLAPSLYEGFGLTVLEAMACGTPVITSNTTSLPEVAGDAAILVDPLDVKAIAQAVHQLYTSPEQCNELIAKGLKRVQTFTWENTAEQIAQVYEMLCNQPSGNSLTINESRSHHPSHHPSTSSRRAYR